MATEPRVALREATADDAATIATLVRWLARATGEEHKVLSAPDDFARHGFGSAPAFRALLAERDGEAIGLALWFYNFSSWRGELGAYLQDIYVDEAARGTGLGRRLLAATAQRAQADGATHLRLSVAADNEGARAFYEHLGFTYRDDECIYQVADAGFDALASLAPDTDSHR